MALRRKISALSASQTGGDHVFVAVKFAYHGMTGRLSPSLPKKIVIGQDARPSAQQPQYCYCWF